MVTADAIVIGAGVIGSAVALELARGGRDVVSIDRGPGPGTGSTGASSAIVRFHYSTFPGVALAWEAKFRWESWTQHLGGEDPAGTARFIKTGALVLDFPDFPLADVLRCYDAIGIPYERLNAAQITERFGIMDPARHFPPKALTDDGFWADADGQVGGLWTPEGGFIDDPALAAMNLYHAAARHGASSRFGRAVVEVRRRAGRVRGVRLADGEVIHAPVVVNATGPHSGVLNRMAGVTHDFRVTTRPVRKEVHVVPGPATHAATNLPAVSDGDLGIYFRPQIGDGILVGGQEAPCDPVEWLEDPDDLTWHPTQAAYERQAIRLARRVPGASVPATARGVVGVYDVTSDWIPIYDRTALDGYYVAIGTSGNQFKTAPAVGELMRSLIEACEDGHDHDAAPLAWNAPVAGVQIGLGHFSRLRTQRADAPHSALG